MTAIEYGLIAALISVAVIAGVTVIGLSINDLYLFWSQAVVNATS